MMLLGQDDRGRWLRVALVTTHLPLKPGRRPPDARQDQGQVDRALTRPGLPRPRPGPRAGSASAGSTRTPAREARWETEEARPSSDPRCSAARRRQGLTVVGPLAADTLFYQAYQGEYDAVVAMYHDQGLAPLKMVAFESGVNWTLGPPVYPAPRPITAPPTTLPATAWQANPSSMVAAIRLAKQLAAHRASAAGRGRGVCPGR